MLALPGLDLGQADLCGACVAAVQQNRERKRERERERERERRKDPAVREWEREYRKDPAVRERERERRQTPEGRAAWAANAQIQVQRRAARKRHLLGPHPPGKYWREEQHALDPRCRACGAHHETAATMHMAHDHADARHGLWDISNLFVACWDGGRSCEAFGHGRQGIRTLSEWKAGVFPPRRGEPGYLLCGPGCGACDAEARGELRPRRKRRIA